MSPTMTLKGQLKFSVKKVISGADVNTSKYIGPGELLLAPPMLGDITSVRLSGSDTWSVGHDAYLASTQGVVKDHKRQGLGKAIFSGEGLWVYKMSGTGIMWVTSFGAIVRKDVRLPPWTRHDCGGNRWLTRQGSSLREKSTLSTTATWSPGTQSTCWREWPRAASSPTLPREKGWCASLRARAPSFSSRGTR